MIRLVRMTVISAAAILSATGISSWALPIQLGSFANVTSRGSSKQDSQYIEALGSVSASASRVYGSLFGFPQEILGATASANATSLSNATAEAPGSVGSLSRVSGGDEPNNSAHSEAFLFRRFRASGPGTTYDLRVNVQFDGTLYTHRGMGDVLRLGDSVASVSAGVTVVSDFDPNGLWQTQFSVFSGTAQLDYGRSTPLNPLVVDGDWQQSDFIENPILDSLFFASFSVNFSQSYTPATFAIGDEFAVLVTLATDAVSHDAINVLADFGSTGSFSVSTNTPGITLLLVQPALLPVPEIETYTMMLAGLAMLALIVPRRRVGPQRHSARLADGRTARTR